MIETIKVSSKGQIVIPESVREKLGIKEGSKLILIEKEKKLVLELEKNFMKDWEELKKIQEDKGWLFLAEKNMNELWNNSKDEKVWSKYL
jgi:AbrB family looped-hinge helix DNA binding protein